MTDEVLAVAMLLVTISTLWAHKRIDAIWTRIAHLEQSVRMTERR